MQEGMPQAPIAIEALQQEWIFFYRFLVTGVRFSDGG